MQEIKKIIAAFEEAQKKGKRSALATVVHVQGSSYRRPGARMLVTEDGLITGAISGGCLEGDALRKAMLAIAQQQNKLVTYDTTDEDDAQLGVQLGCNGIVHILFEPLSGKGSCAINLLKKITAARQNAVLVTLFSLKNIFQYGTSVLLCGEEQFCTPELLSEAQIMQDAANALSIKESTLTRYQVNGREADAFIEFIMPPIHLVIAGAGNDVQPLVEVAAIIGWDVTVADGRPGYATVQRFPAARHVLVARPSELLQAIPADAQTVFVLMTHNYNYDLAMLEGLIPGTSQYIGILGPKKKATRMLDELTQAGMLLTDEQRARIYGPVGLDIGAETSEEIAISVIAEIKAVLSNAQSASLRTKDHAIHSRYTTPAIHV